MKEKILTILLTLLSLPLLSEGIIRDFDIECKDNVLMCKESLRNGQNYLIAIFPDKCFPCNKNRCMLDRLSRLKCIITYGVFLNRNHYFNFHNTGLVRFSTWYPLNTEKFIKGTAINPNQTTTLLTCGNRILYKKAGTIHFEEYKRIKEILQRRNEKNNSIVH